MALFHDFNISSITPVVLHCDNKSALHIAANPVFHERTKHIDIDCHIVRSMLRQGIISTTHLSTKLQPADLFTKPLPLPQFSSLLSKLRVLNLFATLNLRGDVKDDEDSSARDSSAKCPSAKCSSA